MLTESRTRLIISSGMNPLKFYALGQVESWLAAPHLDHPKDEADGVKSRNHAMF